MVPSDGSCPSLPFPADRGDSGSLVTVLQCKHRRTSVINRANRLEPRFLAKLYASVQLLKHRETDTQQSVAPCLAKISRNQSPSLGAPGEYLFNQLVPGHTRSFRRFCNLRWQNCSRLPYLNHEQYLTAPNTALSRQPVALIVNDRWCTCFREREPRKPRNTYFDKSLAPRRILAKDYPF